MDLTGLWLTPLILLPGVALLILSTAFRFNRLHDEMHELLEHAGRTSEDVVRRLMRRAFLFRNTLVALYVCVALFALASLLGVLLLEWSDASRWVVLGLLGAGIGCLAYAALALIRESTLSLDIIEEHGRQLRDAGAQRHTG
ncbi:DUF2721 domain-containing protein [Rhodocaloribacter sp.]